MKLRRFKLDQRQVDLLFSPIRSKVDVIRMLMNSVKVMLINDELPADRVAGELVLRVSSMSRIFLISEGKFFSVNFPFTVVMGESSVNFSSVYCEEVDHKITSDVLALFTGAGLTFAGEIYEFADAVIELQDNTDGLWSVVRELMMFEDGYLRYDHDPVRSNGRLHPLHHLDVCYSPASTFKLGLNQGIDQMSFIDLLDLESECHYVDSR